MTVTAGSLAGFNGVRAFARSAWAGERSGAISRSPSTHALPSTFIEGEKIDPSIRAPLETSIRRAATISPISVPITVISAALTRPRMLAPASTVSAPSQITSPKTSPPRRSDPEIVRSPTTRQPAAITFPVPFWGAGFEGAGGAAWGGGVLDLSAAMLRLPISTR